jgi:hypothetical protein
LDAPMRARQPCKRQSPRQDRGVVAVITSRTADGSRSPEVDAAIVPDRPPFFDHVCSNRRPINPTKINRVGRAARTARGPGQTVMSLNGLAAALVRRDHPLTGSNLRRAEPQERRRTRSAFRRKPDARGKNRSSGWAARQPEHAGSGTPRQRTRRCMTRLGRRDRQWQGSIGWVRHERASASVTPTTPAWRIEDDATHPR